jgi:hypothetical protein
MTGSGGTWDFVKPVIASESSSAAIFFITDWDFFSSLAMTYKKPSNKGIYIGIM